MSLGLNPDAIGMETVAKEVIANGVSAGGTTRIEVDFGNGIIIGVPEIIVKTANADAKIVSGGKSKIVIDAVNKDTANAQDIVVDVVAVVMKTF